MYIFSFVFCFAKNFLNLNPHILLSLFFFSVWKSEEALFHWANGFTYASENSLVNINSKTRIWTVCLGFLWQCHEKGLLTCLICREVNRDRTLLILHMHNNHTELELPYRCGICHFRASQHNVVVDHFHEVRSCLWELNLFGGVSGARCFRLKSRLWQEVCQ